MKNLNELVHDRIAAKIAAGEKKASTSVFQLVQDAQNGSDFMLKLGKNCKTVFTGEDVVTIETPDALQYTLHDNAIRLLAEKFKIPTRYLRDLAGGTWGQNLAAKTLNEFMQHADQDRFLVRAVNDEVRAVLSENYRRFDSEKIVEQFVKTVSENGGRFVDGYYNGINMWLEMINPEPIVISTKNNGDIHLGYGARIETSDFGKGALNVRGYFLQGACLNGWVRESVLREIHLGSKIPEDMKLSQETITAETNARILKVRDISKNLFESDYVRQRVWEIKKASEIEVDMKAELLKLQKGSRITKFEMEETEKVLLANRYDDGVQGESTLWKLMQGLTATARNLEPERQRKLHEIAGDLLPTYEVQKVLYN